MVLFLPLFQQSKNLGSGKYGLVMAFFTGGMFLAMAAMSLVKIPARKRMPIFMAASFLMAIFFAVFALSDNFVVMSLLIFGGGFSMALVNVFVNSTIQLTVPQEIRGKVFSLISMVCMSLTPFAMAIGGVLGEIFPLRAVIFTCFVVLLAGFVPCCLIKSLKKFINFDPEKDVLEEIME
jgi:MFS family permease